MAFSAVNLSDLIAPPNEGRLLAVTPHVYAGRDAMQEFFDGLDRASPAVKRSVLAGSRPREDSLLVASLELAPGNAHDPATFAAETRTTLGIDMRVQSTQRVPAIFVISLPLAGQMRVTLGGGEYAAEAGEGLLIDPRELERVQFAPGTHLLEFDLPKRCMLTLGAELAPGAVGGTPRFQPRLRADLARRVLLMALQATSGSLRPGGLPNGRQMLSQRWNEMIALTLMTEQPMVDAPRPLSVSAGPAPASLRRALEFIDSHAERDLLLSDIAAAAFVSASSLSRQFNEHLGMSPGAFVRQVRLDRARVELRRGAPGSVRELAQRWGFQNASKFSQAYLRRFGEKPSETRAR